MGCMVLSDQFPEGIVREANGKSHDTTNNRTELRAVIETLRLTPPERRLLVFTDSEYVLKGAVERLDQWISQGWKTAKGKPIKNIDLWEKMYSLLCGRTVLFEQVKGHSGIEGNERADALANMAINGKEVRPI